VSRKKRKTQREVNEATARAISLGCYGMCSRGAPVSTDSILASTASESSVSSANSSVSEFVIRSKNENSPYEPGKGKRPVPPESNLSLRQKKLFSIEEEFRSHMNLALPTYHHHEYSPSSLTNSPNSSETYQTFEPTPLTQVLPRLYLGTQEDAEQEEKMRSLGITHIISIVGGGRYKDLCGKHMYVPLRDNGSSDLLEKLENSYDFMVESQDPDNKLFIHCQLGQNRSASFVIGFLMRYKELSFHEAYMFLKEKRELIHPHKKYIEQLRELDKQLHKVYSTPEDFLNIEICPQEGIKILHHDFSRVASQAYKRKQSLNLEEEKDDSLSDSSLLDDDQDPDEDKFITICLPESESGQIIPTNAEINDKSSHPLASGATRYKF